MTEEVLQFIWQTQSFKKTLLNSERGSKIEVLNQGVLNTDSGPDFANARIKIDSLEWVGDIEIHIKSSDWDVHKHQFDSAYNKVVLHVVWVHDKEVKRSDDSVIPTIALKGYVSQEWLEKYNQLSTSLHKIPCQAFFSRIDSIYKFEAFNKVLVNRLERKAKDVLNNLDFNKGDWEKVALSLLFENFGFKKNNEAFKQLAFITDIRILRKLTSKKQLESYLMGMAGLLPKGETVQGYPADLANEFNWIRTKFRIQTEPMSATWWKFMRMRPANFPTIRMAQLAALLSKHKSFFRVLIELSPNDTESFFKVSQSDFWQSHYHFNKESARKLTGIGDQSIRILTINVAAVLLVAYGQYTGIDEYIEKAITFLEKMKAEDNKIIRIWNELGVNPDNAAESQGAIELFNNYCIQRRCLTCNIGRQVLQPE